MMALGALPQDTVIIEDSVVGRKGALDSKCHMIPVEDRRDLNQAKIDNIKKILNSNNTLKKVAWEDQAMNILIPMA